MKILYLDTSSSFLYTAIVENDLLVDQLKINLGKDLSTYTLSMIQDLFKRNEISPNSIEKIIVVNGPGSFTGVRIGLTIAKTYAWSMNIPIITISSLDAMAVSFSDKIDYLVPLIDARRGYAFAGVYDSNYLNIIENQYISIDELCNKVNKLEGSHVFITNDNLNFVHSKYDPDILKIVLKFQNHPSVNPHLVDANYLKLTEAEEKKNDN